MIRDGRDFERKAGRTHFDLARFFSVAGSHHRAFSTLRFKLTRIRSIECSPSYVDLSSLTMFAIPALVLLIGSS